MKTIQKEKMCDLIGGRNPDWGDFATGLCMSTGFGLALVGLFTGNPILSYVGGAAGMACSGRDMLPYLRN